MLCQIKLFILLTLIQCYFLLAECRKEREEAPRVEIWPQGEQAVALGSQYQLDCRVLGGVPEPDVTWARAGGRPLSSYAHIQPPNILWFDRVEVNDEGEYTCSATNVVGSDSASSILKVFSPPEITGEPELVPIILDLKTENRHKSCEVRPSNITVLENGSIKITQRGPRAHLTSIRVGGVERRNPSDKINKHTHLQMDKIQGGSWIVTFKILEGKNKDDDSIYTYISCIFTTHVKRTDVLSISISGELLTTTLSDLSTGYDAEVRYEFFDGELADITCGKRDELQGRIQLTYKHYHVFNTMTKHGTTNIQAKLRAEDNNTYALCKYEPLAGEDWALVKILLVLHPHDDTDAELSIRVNGLRRKSTTLHELKTQYNESIKIDCERKDDSIGILSWDYDKWSYRFVKDNTETKAVDTTTNISISFLPGSFNYIYVKCMYKPDVLLPHKNITNVTVHFKLDKETPFYITGLQEDNKLVVYDQTNESYTWTNLEYEYVGTELLNLTCKSNFLYWGIIQPETLEWKSDSEKFTSPNNKLTVLLDDRTNNTELRCIDKGKHPPPYKHLLILNEIHIKMIQREKRSTVHATPAPDTKKQQTHKNNIDLNESSTTAPVVMIGVPAGAIAMLVILAVVIMKLIPRKTSTCETEDREGPNIDNAIDNNEEPEYAEINDPDIRPMLEPPPEYSYVYDHRIHQVEVNNISSPDTNNYSYVYDHRTKRPCNRGVLANSRTRHCNCSAGNTK